jgi:SAM-dependent methyltransferase
MKYLRKFLGDKYYKISVFILKYIRPLKSRQYDINEKCFSCGEDCRMYFNPWVINRQTLKDWGNKETANEYLVRESSFCGGCGAPFRIRRIAEVLLEKMCKQNHNFLNQCLYSGEFNDLSILQLNEIGGVGSLQKTLGNAPNVTTTFYNTEYDFGKVINGFSNQDMSNLTFESNSFDLVLHSEVLEHVVDFCQAHLESIRVLKSGGVLIFTVPIQLNNAKTISRFEVDPFGELILQTPKIWHGWAGGPFAILPKRDDYLELHSFGADAFSLFKSNQGRLERHQSNSFMKSGGDWVFSFIKF